MKSLSLKSTDDACLACRLSLVDATCQLLVAKTASILWVSVVLKRRDALLATVKDSMSFESYMDLHKAKILSGSELFPSDVLEKTIEKSSKVLPMKLHFSATPHL